MSLECVVSIVQRQKRTGNDLKNLGKKQHTNLYSKRLGGAGVKVFVFNDESHYIFD